MKKKIVLISLFILPIFVYVFFALASHNSLFLDTIRKDLPEIPTSWKTSNGDTVSLENKITIIGFPGQNKDDNKANFFNLNQKIYQKFKGFEDFQLVMVCPKGMEQDIEEIQLDIERMANLSGWKFVFAEQKDIINYFNEWNIQEKLTPEGSPNVFIVDKDKNLRGRNGKDLKGKTEYKESYYTTSGAQLHNEMTDDFKIILREYRLALKKNDPNRRKNG